jgi:alpha-galactosidase
VLRPGETFTTVPVSLAVATDAGAAFAALTESRRAHRRPHPDHEALPIVFNDFMNGLMGDPTTDRLLPLVTAAARAGAECFCIDAGWYADDGEWWDGVGEWLPSQRRFPGGLGQVIQAIRDEGMVPGLWLEPEVVGIRSPLATRLPDAAFFQRDGARVIEAARYQLDFRHPATLAHLDAVVDRLVDEFGIGYLKLDYNIDVLTGTDLDADSPGAGQLGHARAYLAWIGRVLDRHPGLVLENCASGGQRMDQALLALHQLQSVSDNQDPLHTAAIAASAPTAVTPEQAAVWAFPQHGWSAELIAFTVVNSLLGRVHLSGRIDLLDEDEARLVADGMRVYRDIRHLLARGRPFWPLGLPGWHDDWLALGIAGEDETLLTVWRRGGDTRIVLPLRGELGLGGPALDRPAPDAPTAWRADVLYPPPAAHPTAWEWEAPGRLAIELPAEPSARLLRLRPSSAGQGRD